jgi:hypothetical protein
MVLNVYLNTYIIVRDTNVCLVKEKCYDPWAMSVRSGRLRPIARQISWPLWDNIVHVCFGWYIDWLWVNEMTEIFQLYSLQEQVYKQGKMVAFGSAYGRKFKSTQRIYGIIKHIHVVLKSYHFNYFTNYWWNLIFVNVKCIWTIDKRYYRCLSMIG